VTARTAATAFVFTTPLLSTQKPAFYWISIPARVSRAIGRRGPVPIVATINGSTELQASLVPVGGGRHRLALNTRVRGEAAIAPGDRVKVDLRVDDNPRATPTPPDLAHALRENGALETFERFPVGSRNHIIEWIEKSVAERTREKRVADTVEVALRRFEREHDRAPRRSRSPS
jgi:hypothetical protein